MFQAPDLTRDIWRRPDTSTDAEIIPNLISGYMAGRQVAKENRDAQDAANVTGGEVKNPRSFMDSFGRAFFRSKSIQDESNPLYQLKMSEARAQLAEAGVKMQGTILHNQMLEQDHMDILSDQRVMAGLQEAIKTNQNYFASNPVNPFKSRQYQGLFDKMSDNYNQSQIAKTDSLYRKHVADELGKVFQASPEDYPDIKATLDPLGNPTKATGIALKEIAPKIKAWEQEQAQNKASVLAAQTRGEYSLERTAMVNASRESINQSNLDAKAKQLHTEKLSNLDHYQLKEYQYDLDMLKALEKSGIGLKDKAATANSMELQKAKIRFYNKWNPRFEGMEQKATSSTEPPAAPASGIPKPGEIRKGYIFKGGDPSDKNSWEALDE